MARHSRPHLSQGLCECDCRRCTVTTPSGQDVCICPDCDAVRCGMHGGVYEEPPLRKG